MEEAITPANGRRICRFLAILIAFSLMEVTAGSARAQDPEDELGNWLIFNSTVRYSDRWSLFTEAQGRLWETVSNLEEWLVKAAALYDLSPQAIVGLGYHRSESWPFQNGPRRTENRIYQQFAIRHAWSRSQFEHRYRLEQRWFEEAGRTSYSNRFRYRLQVTTPLNRAMMEPGAKFLNVYNEIFLNFDSQRTFDQNRFYVAGGHQFTDHSNLQIGMLWQAPWWSRSITAIWG